MKNDTTPNVIYIFPDQMQHLPWQENKEIVSDLCKQMVSLLKELIPYGKE